MTPEATPDSPDLARRTPEATLERRALGAAALAALLWGGTFVLGKIALGAVTPTWLIAWRFGLASLCLLPFVRWREIRLGRSEWLIASGGGTLAALVVFLLQFEGLARTTASSAALLVAVAPPLFAIAAWAVDGEKPGPATWAAVGLSVIGVLLLVGRPGAGRTVLGDTLCVLSMVGAVAWTLLSRRLARRVGALASTALQFACGWAVLIALGLWRGGPALPDSPEAWGAILALGTVCTALTFWLFNWSILHIAAARAGVLANIEPAVGAGLGMWLLGETLGPLAALGGGLLILAALLASVPTRAAPVLPSASPEAASPSQPLAPHP